MLTLDQFQKIGTKGMMVVWWFNLVRQQNGSEFLLDGGTTLEIFPVAARSVERPIDIKNDCLDSRKTWKRWVAVGR